MTAAAQLLGMSLPDGWKVIKQIDRSHFGSGGTFSHCYLADRRGRIAFVKAFDFSSAFEDNVDTVHVLSLLTASYEHERDVLEHCRGRNLSHVAAAIGHGHISVPMLGLIEGRVYYLLFERADGDIRRQMDKTDSLGAVWCMRTFRHICLALWQIHRELIAHQDVKPSNILSYDRATTRLADFGRSSRRGHSIWHDDIPIAGDRSYAPPELLYGYIGPAFEKRRLGTDVYMLGNIAAFLFTGVNLTASLMANLHPDLHHKNWKSSYATLLPYLEEAFARVLEDIENELAPVLRSDLMPILYQLGNPDLARRGHPKRLGTRMQFSLEPYVSILTRLTKEVEIMTRVGKLST